MANLSESWSLTMSTTDVVSSVIVAQRTPPSLANTGFTTLSYNDYLVLANGANVIPMPIAAVYGLYIRNLGSAGQEVTVAWTPNGGALATVKALGPLGVILFLETAIAAANSITSITLTAGAANIPVEYKLLG